MEERQQPTGITDDDGTTTAARATMRRRRRRLIRRRTTDQIDDAIVEKNDEYDLNDNYNDIGGDNGSNIIIISQETFVDSSCGDDYRRVGEDYGCYCSSRPSVGLSRPLIKAKRIIDRHRHRRSRNDCCRIIYNNNRSRPRKRRCHHLELLVLIILLQFSNNIMSSTEVGATAATTTTTSSSHYRNRLLLNVGENHQRDNQYYSERLLRLWKRSSSSTISKTALLDYNNTSSSQEKVEEEHNEADEDDQKYQHCTVIESCRVCTGTDKEEIPECIDTGKVLISSCIPVVDNDDEELGETATTTKSVSAAQYQGPDSQPGFVTTSSSSSQQAAPAAPVIVYESCNRTTAEDEFLLIRLEMLCLVLGSIAVLQVRKQKLLTASLFDQRRRESRIKKQEQQKQRDLNVLNTTTPSSAGMRGMSPIPILDENANMNDETSNSKHDKRSRVMGNIADNAIELVSTTFLGGSSNGKTNDAGRSPPNGGNSNGKMTDEELEALIMGGGGSSSTELDDNIV